MGLKENMNAIKKELSTEEQFLESVIKAEGFFKKYKKLLIIVAVLVIALSLAYVFYQSTQKSNLDESNRAFVALQSDPTNKTAIETLKSKNPRLYQLFLFSSEVKSNDPVKLQSLKSQITDPILKDLLTYQEASLLEKDLRDYSMKKDALLKDLASLESVYLLLEEGKSKEAATILAQIPANSALNEIVQSLKHYMK